MHMLADWEKDLFWKASKICYFIVLYFSVVQNFEYQTLPTNFVLPLSLKMSVVEKHSKGKEIGYEELSLQEYLQADSPLSIKEKRFAFAVRSRGLDLKNNFKAGKSDLNGRLCKENLEDQAHLLTCPALSKVGRTQALQPPYSDMFSQNIEELKQITKLLLVKFTHFSTQVNRLQPKKSSSAAKVSTNVNHVSTLTDFE